MLEKEIESILKNRHTLEVGRYVGAHKTSLKVLQSRFYWLSLFKDSFKFFNASDQC